MFHYILTLSCLERTVFIAFITVGISSKCLSTHLIAQDSKRAVYLITYKKTDSFSLRLSGQNLLQIQEDSGPSYLLRCHCNPWHIFVVYFANAQVPFGRNFETEIMVPSTVLRNAAHLPKIDSHHHSISQHNGACRPGRPNETKKKEKVRVRLCTQKRYSTPAFCANIRDLSHWPFWSFHVQHVASVVPPFYEITRKFRRNTCTRAAIT